MWEKDAKQHIFNTKNVLNNMKMMFFYHNIFNSINIHDKEWSRIIQIF